MEYRLALALFMETLTAIVRRSEVENMLQNARLTRDWPILQEQRTEAERQVRMVMYRAALGEITEEERRQIFDILRPCCPDLFVTPPSACLRSPDARPLAGQPSCLPGTPCPRSS